MEKNYWQGRWARSEIGWHQKEIEPSLTLHFSSLKPTRVFVPFCGKSLDLSWLASLGHEVIGVELSETACRQFFEEAKIPFEEKELGAFKVFESQMIHGNNSKIKILNGDFFDLKPELLGPLGAVYDRAALIALPDDLRATYATQMIRLVCDCSTSGDFEFLQITLERAPHDLSGPPFSVPFRELESIYSKNFRITALSRELVEGMDQAEECVYLLRIA